MWWHGGAGLAERSERGSLSAVATHDVFGLWWCLQVAGNPKHFFRRIRSDGIAGDCHTEVGIRSFESRLAVAVNSRCELMNINRHELGVIHFGDDEEVSGVVGLGHFQFDREDLAAIECSEKLRGRFSRLQAVL